MSKGIKNLLKYGITVTLCLVVSVLVAWNRGLFTATKLDDIYRILSDAFYLPGILLVLFGLLMWLAGEGALMGIGYVMKSLVRLIIPFRQHETYAEYVAKKAEKEKVKFGFLLIVGLAFFLVGVVFLILHMQVNTHNI